MTDHDMTDHDTQARADLKADLTRNLTATWVHAETMVDTLENLTTPATGAGRVAVAVALAEWTATQDAAQALLDHLRDATPTP